MTELDQTAETASGLGCKRRSPIATFMRSRDGSAAIEFALLAIPYFMVIFAIIETFIAFAGEQLVSNAVDTMSRKVRTGQITAANTDRTAFRTAFCNEIAILISCSTTEAATPSKLFVDVQKFSTFAAIPTTIAKTAGGDINTASFQYAPGGAGTINMVRAYYKWQIITDLIRPYISSIKPTDGSSAYYLIVATATFQNEQYP
ncbi:TadE/TadG family type IV pilus assembly protein [Rhizobium sp. 18055]|jgi:Flp pilus assembly protein TadG|uniref:TadE/TadG family type IV pilus assembly protein n=1 Tax=Rhizobium sp. 18055 TaxID=2681403 RepID=UPI001356BFEA|nr:TadE/TadG family type IV pilus assembly protein [Rhizobium sp. 18055]